MSSQLNPAPSHMRPQQPNMAFSSNTQKMHLLTQEEQRIDTSVLSHMANSDSERPNRFKDTVMAIYAIVEGKLYKTRYSSLEAYFTEVWHISRAQVYRFYNCARILRELHGMTILPNRERLCRSLKRYGRNKQARRLLWKTVIDRLNGDESTLTSNAITNAWHDLVSMKLISASPQQGDMDDRNDASGSGSTASPGMHSRSNPVLLQPRSILASDPGGPSNSAYMQMALPLPYPNPSRYYTVPPGIPYQHQQQQQQQQQQQHAMMSETPASSSAYQGAFYNLHKHGGPSHMPTWRHRSVTSVADSLALRQSGGGSGSGYVTSLNRTLSSSTFASTSQPPSLRPSAELQQQQQPQQLPQSPFGSSDLPPLQPFDSRRPEVGRGGHESLSAGRLMSNFMVGTPGSLLEMGGSTAPARNRTHSVPVMGTALHHARSVDGMRLMDGMRPALNSVNNGMTGLRPGDSKSPRLVRRDSVESIGSSSSSLGSGSNNGEASATATSAAATAAAKNPSLKVNFLLN